MIRLSLSLLLLAFVAAAEIPQEVKTEIDLRIKHNINPSIVVGLFENDQSYFYTQGLINKEHPQPANKNSVYEIGSVTKTFTSLLLATLVQDKKIKLEDAIQDYWPKPFVLQDSENQAITFKQLATHTSGLPRLPYNLMAFSQDPYANYDRIQLIEAVNNTKPVVAGTQYDYSNFAVGILGETLALIENQSFDTLIEQSIIKPLGLTHTYMQLAQVPEGLLAQGYTGQKPVSAWNFKALAAAGSIRSSINDLLAYGVAYINLNNILSQAMQLTMTPHYQNDQLSVGLGWHINGGIIWHNGGTQGFKSIIMLDPINKRVAAGITNQSNNDVEDIVAYLIDPNQPMKKFAFPVTIPDQELLSFIGEFKHAGTEKIIHISQEKQKLIFNAKGQKNQVLSFIGEDTFKFGIMKIKVKFNKNNNGEVTSLSLMGWGKPQIYEKLTNH